jgi:hypothetical protein
MLTTKYHTKFSSCHPAGEDEIARRKNKNAPRMGHPKFHVQRIEDTGEGLRAKPE